MNTLCKRVLLTGAMVFAGQAGAQATKIQTDFAVTYTAERAKPTPSDCGCFWLNGGSADGAITFFKGLGVAANLTGGHAGNIMPGVSLSKVSVMVGPRYTWDAGRLTGGFARKHPTQIFGEWLFGGAHGFDSTFPAAGGVSSSANSFSTQGGAGLDIALLKGFGVRALELDYVHTSLPNNGSNSQNDFRIAFGVSWRSRSGASMVD